MAPAEYQRVAGDGRRKGERLPRVAVHGESNGPSELFRVLNSALFHLRSDVDGLRDD